MNTLEIKKTIEEFLRAMGVEPFELEVTDDGGNPKFLIKTPHSALLIGNRGEHLSAITHIVRRIVSSKVEKVEEPLKFFIDINNYQEENLSHIKNKALVIAERVRSFKTNIEMEPMSSYERMSVHALFTLSPDIKTESIGVGPSRRVVIKYVGGEGGEEGGRI